MNIIEALSKYKRVYDPAQGNSGWFERSDDGSIHRVTKWGNRCHVIANMNFLMNENYEELKQVPKLKLIK